MRPLLSCLLILPLCTQAAEKPTTRPATIRIPDTTVTFDLIQLPQGQITLKDKDGKETTHNINPIWIGKTEVTWDEFDQLVLDAKKARLANRPDPNIDALLGPSDPAIYGPPDRGWGHHGWPFGSLSFLTAKKYCVWLSKKTGHKYRLPTEAEWEYACRSGGPALLPDPKTLDEFAWFEKNSDDQTQEVAKKRPNAWGLYDMLGNVAEWVTLEHGAGIAAGGSFQDEAKYVHSNHREPYDRAWQRDDPQDPKSKYWLSNGGHIGFRLVRED